MKPLKPLKNAHTSNTKKGSGDYYGVAVRQKVGKPIDVEGMKVVPPKKMKVPPRSLA